SRSLRRSRSSSAAKPAATQKNTPTSAEFRRSRWRLSMKQKLTTPVDAPVGIRVVIVTLDTHLASAAERAREKLASELPGLTLNVHAASEWDHDSESLQRCRGDIEQGDIVFASMLFLEDHFRAVLPWLSARRDRCDAMVCCMSAGEVIKLTRLGRFSMN